MGETMSKGEGDRKRRTRIWNLEFIPSAMGGFGGKVTYSDLYFLSPLGVVRRMGSRDKIGTHRTSGSDSDWKSL